MTWQEMACTSGRLAVDGKVWHLKTTVSDSSASHTELVKDMLDLKAVHMTYLTESLHICFLSDGTQPIAGIIQNILQCAIDFRSCFTRSVLDAGSDDEKVTNRFSRPDISKVQTIRSTFIKNLEDLYLIYLQSPKHGEFGLCRFWDYLNYNEYYANKQMAHSIM